MLLAVLGLAEAGDLVRNEIRFDPTLLERYMKFFTVVRSETDHANPHFPFFHLSSEGFWHLQPLPSREAVVASMDSARSVSAITDNIAWVSLDPGLHALALAEPSRTALREELPVAWFGSQRRPLEQVIEDERGSDRYETLSNATKPYPATAPPENIGCRTRHPRSPRAAPNSAAS